MKRSRKRILLGVTVVLGLITFAQITPSVACACLPEWRTAAATMRGDLGSVMMAQEEFFAEHGRYATSLGDLPEVSPRYEVVVEGQPTGYRAVSWAAGAHDWMVLCEMSVGLRVPTGEDGVPRCSTRPPAKVSLWRYVLGD